jgi:hypothetical protein
VVEYRGVEQVTLWGQATEDSNRAKSFLGRLPHQGYTAKLVAIVDVPDAEAAIARAIEQENVPPNERGRLLAMRRDGELANPSSPQAPLAVVYVDAYVFRWKAPTKLATPLKQPIS